MMRRAISSRPLAHHVIDTHCENTCIALYAILSFYDLASNICQPTRHTRHAFNPPATLWFTLEFNNAMS
jgi:hypothetical protein